MTGPPRFERAAPWSFLGPKPVEPSYADARVVILPVPLDRTTSYSAGTKFGPREILAASAFVELWDEELQVDPHRAGIHTLPEVEFHTVDLDEIMRDIRRIAGEILRAGKFPVVLGGEHSITPPVVAAVAEQYPGVSVLQIDAHADLRDEYLGTANSHACAIRRSLEHAPVTAVGIRALSEEEHQLLPSLSRYRVFYDWNMRQDAAWIERVVDTLAPQVYVTIDVDGMDPAIVPATGTPEPGGLSWREMTTLLRAVFARRQVVGFDVVELMPIPGLVAPNFLCARLVYKMLGYKFAPR